MRKICLLLVLFFLSGCGYHNPNILTDEEAGPPIKLYVPLWTNPTSETRLATDIHNALQDWLIQSKRLILVGNAASADYILKGRIVSVRYPGRSYNVKDTALALKAILTVEYSVRDVKTDKPVWEAKGYSLEETYTVGSSTAQTDANKKTALELIVNDLAENIYIRIYRAISRHRKGTGADNR
ncbi:LPS assembly lipoprotein LptE [Thiovibrio sp. JS02]